MRGPRVSYPEPYAGHWAAFDPSAPWHLYQEAQAGDDEASRAFLEAAVAEWSFGPPPREKPEELEVLPWDVGPLTLALFSAAHAVSDEEDLELMMRVHSDQSRRRIPELEKFRVLERLGMPLAPTFEELRAGETLRLVRLLGALDEIQAMKKPG